MRSVRSEGEGLAAEISELTSEAEFKEAFPVIRELHHELGEQRFLDLLPQMVPGGYRLFVVREGLSRQIVACVGVQVLTNLYHGRHAYVYDLVATADARSRGHAQKLMEHVEDFARRQGCEYVALACGRERDDALRFYERLGFARPGYSMRKAFR